MHFLYFSVSLLATIFGGICGVGGGVVIKPVLDAAGTMSVSSVSFLSGCTVLAMTMISVLRNRKNKGILDLRTSTALAIGAAVGGLIGKEVFDLLKSAFADENRLGAVQAGLLIIVTVGSLLYSIYAKRIKTLHVRNLPMCIAIGLLLGMISSFLGIGGGPVNLTVLFYFFSMDTKKAAANSLYIIMFSQLFSLVQTVAGRTVPKVSVTVLGLMVVAGVLGGMLGNRINRKITAKAVDRLFIGFMTVIIGINIYNIVNFTI